MRGSVLATGVLLLVAAGTLNAGQIYDPQADAWQQLETAGQRAAAGHQRVLAIIGGDW
jgi:hypothetical protein